MIAPESAPIDTKFLHRFILESFLDALKVEKNSPLRIPLRPLLWLPTRLFVRLSVNFDQQVAQNGFDGAANWMLPRFVDRVEVQDAEYIPKQGPLIIASNHPGNLDSVALVANIPRPDLKILALDIALIQALPHLSQYFIYSTENNSSAARMLAVRSAIRHLQAGGALLIFPSGHVSPDPAVLPGAVENLKTWSPSLELFLRKVPETKVQLAAISHLSTPRFFNNTFARRLIGISRQIISQHLQVVYQLLRPHRFLPNPKLSFAKPLTYPQLQQEGDTYQSIIEHAALLLMEHIKKYKGSL